MALIAPSILSADFSRLAEEIQAAEKAGADMIHLDVMDGLFVPNITFGQEVVRSIRKTTTLPFDTHLMIERPERYVREFAQAGADIITVHYEATAHLNRTVQAIKEEGKKAGVTINPATPLCVLEEILPHVDLLLIMTVNPGFGGQSFIPGSLEKIRKARRMIDDIGGSILLEVDGGIKLENAQDVIEAGADVLVMGSAFFGEKDYPAFVRKLRRKIEP